MRLGRYEEALAYQQDSPTATARLRHSGILVMPCGPIGRDREEEEPWRDALAICQALQIPKADG